IGREPRLQQTFARKLTLPGPYPRLHFPDDAFPPHEALMDQPKTAAKITGQEHWTKKGDVRLFLWEKRAAGAQGAAGTILFVHGSSMASQPTFDLQVPGR